MSDDLDAVKSSVYIGYRVFQLAAEDHNQPWTLPTRSEVRQQVVKQMQERGYGFVQMVMLALAIFNAVTWILDRLRERNG